MAKVLRQRQVFFPVGRAANPTKLAELMSSVTANNAQPFLITVGNNVWVLSSGVVNESVEIPEPPVPAEWVEVTDNSDPQTEPEL